MTNPRRWELYPRLPDDALHELKGWGPILAQVLFNRGISTQAEAEAFMEGTLQDLHDPYLLKDMDKAVERIMRAVRQGESVAIYGDYDADGVCSSVILYQTIKCIHPKVIFYIPERAEEGYGMNQKALSQLVERGVRLIITVDCGISNIAEVQAAREAGIDVIITDHHHVPDELPPACAILNPKQPNCPYPYKELAGAGVAYKLSEALRTRSGFVLPFEALDLVALATVADIVPLMGENRTLVTLGIKQINQGKRPGMLSLIEVSGYHPGDIDSYHLGYHLAPRLNAAGRLTHAADAVKLFLAEDSGEAQEIARHLNYLNTRRQQLTEHVLQQAKAEVIRLPKENKIILVAGEEWPAGILGLVAGKLCEEFYRPTLVLEKGKTISRGSARSINGFNITEALTQCRTLLLQFGGHAMAAGFELYNDQVDALHQCLDTIVDQILADEDFIPLMKIDSEINLGDITYPFYQALERLAPFGYRNPRPLFMSRGVRPLHISQVGSQKNHLRLQLAADTVRHAGIAFGMGSSFPQIKDTDSIDTVYTIDENIWEGVQTIQLKIKDFRASIMSK